MRKPVLKKVVRPRDTRTVRRRLARMRERAPELGMTPWVSRVEEKLPERMGSMGSAPLPSTTHAIERFVRAFQRFDRARGSLHSVLRATRARRLLIVGSLFTQHATTGTPPSK